MINRDSIRELVHKRITHSLDLRPRMRVRAKKFYANRGVDNIVYSDASTGEVLAKTFSIGRCPAFSTSFYGAASGVGSFESYSIGGVMGAVADVKRRISEVLSVRPRMIATKHIHPRMEEASR